MVRREHGGVVAAHGRAAPFVLAPFNEQRRIADKLEAVLARGRSVPRTSRPPARPLGGCPRNVLANLTNAGLVGYHRKRAGTELHKGAFAGFLPLELFERVQQVRQERARRPKQGANYRVYLLSGLTWCSTCGAQVTACEGRRMRCRRSAQHERCREPSAKAEHLEQQLGAWLCSQSCFRRTSR